VQSRIASIGLRRIQSKDPCIGEGVRVVLSLPNTVPDGAKVNPAAAPGAPPVQPASAAAPDVKPAPTANPQQPK
jgi:hypothetical protein